MPSRPLFGRIVAAAGFVAAHEYPAGLMAAPHFHDHSYLTILLAGQAVEHFAHRAETLVTGTVHLMIAGERHSNEYLADTRCLHVEADSVIERVGAVEPGPFRTPRASLLGTLIADEFHHRDDLSALAIEGLLFALLVRPAREHADAAHWLTRVTDALHDSLETRPSLLDLAEIAGVHPAHLCREFHRRTGRTIGAYVRELRIARACTMLSQSNESLAEIALACGFSDQSHFATTFRRAMHVTPGEYRRSTAK